MRGCVRWVFARSTWSPLKASKFWWGTQSIWMVDEGWPRRRRLGCGVSSPWSTPPTHILLAAAPATGWDEAVAKARYLLILLAQTPAAEDPRRATLIADVFGDFKRLLAESKHPPAAGDAEKGKPKIGRPPRGRSARPETGIRQLNPRKC